MDRTEVDLTIRKGIDEVLGSLIEELGRRIRISASYEVSGSLEEVINAIEQTRKNLGGQDG